MKNALGLTSGTMAIMGIVMAIIVSVRKAIVSRAQARSKFGKAVANLGKMLVLLLAPSNMPGS